MAAMRQSRRRPRSSALNTNGAGSFNIASGTNALLRNTIGHDNVATGMKALLANKTGPTTSGSGRARAAS